MCCFRTVGSQPQIHDWGLVYLYITVMAPLPSMLHLCIGVTLGALRGGPRSPRSLPHPHPHATIASGCCSYDTYLAGTVCMWKVNSILMLNSALSLC
jgi:hypothetical protein